jgi:septal ring factor EnvC (AmiA/AmiB activator)
MRRVGPILRALCIAVAMVLCCAAAHAFDDAVITAAETQEANMRSDLERVLSAITQADVTDVQLADQRGLIEKLQLAALAQVDSLNAPSKDLTQQLNQLGPAPAKGVSEAASIAAQRQSLTDSVNRISAAQKQFSLLSLEAEQTTSKFRLCNARNFLSVSFGRTFRSLILNFGKIRRRASVCYIRVFPASSRCGGAIKARGRNGRRWA